MEAADGRRAALLVAAHEYHDPKLARLRAPPHDVEALQRVLQDPSIGDYQVRVLINEAKATVEEEIEDFFADRKPDDLLLLYFSCHGVKDLTGRLYFATSSTRVSRLASTGLSSAWINEQLERSRSKRVLVLLDCCYSGAFAKGLAPRSGPRVTVSESLGGRGRAVITASDAMEYAWEGDELALDEGQPSVFTRAVVAGLETGDADRDGDGAIAVEELYDYIYDEVRRATAHQTPTKSSYGEQGDLIIARNPRPPVPTVQPEPLPLELDSALHDQRPFIRRATVAELQALRIGDLPGLALSATRALQHLADHDDEPDIRAAAAAALVTSVPPLLGDVPPTVPEPESAARTPAEQEVRDDEPAVDPEAVDLLGDDGSPVRRFIDSLHLKGGQSPRPAKPANSYSTAAIICGVLAVIPFLFVVLGPVARKSADAAQRDEEPLASSADQVARAGRALGILTTLLAASFVVLVLLDEALPAALA